MRIIMNLKKSGLQINDIKNFMSEKRIIYDHNIDQRGYKWSGKSKLIKVPDNHLPDYILSNIDKYTKWLD